LPAGEVETLPSIPKKNDKLRISNCNYINKGLNLANTRYMWRERQGTAITGQLRAFGYICDIKGHKVTFMVDSDRRSVYNVF
jgi:hypothetical protein